MLNTAMKTLYEEQNETRILLFPYSTFNYEHQTIQSVLPHPALVSNLN